MHLPPTPPSFGTNLPQIVTHICQKAIFKHALEDYIEYMALPQRKHEGCIPVEKRRDNRFLVEFDHVSFTPFVIMDEPTAALDPESECEVYAGFDKMVGNKTAIYISHRLASCRFCGDILVFDRGAVVQRGRHEELERQEGLYRELWNAQAQYYM